MISADSLLENFPGSVNGFMFKNGPVSVFLNQNPGSEFKLKDSSSPSNHSESNSDSGGGTSSNGESSDTTKHSNPILRYISDILMDEEDDLERKPCMLQDCLRLQAAEKSFYDVLGRSYPSSPRCDDNPDPDDHFGGTTSSESYSTDNSCVSDLVNGAGDFESSFLRRSVVDSPENALEVPDAAPDPFRETQAAVQFSNGYLNMIHAQSKKQVIGEGLIWSSTEARGSREKRLHVLNDISHVEEEERSNKLSAVYADDSEPSSMFDEVLLCSNDKSPSIFCADGEPIQNADPGGSNGKTTRSKKGSNKGSSKSPPVDLWTLLTQCAQAVSSYDQRNASEILKQIRQHSSPFGDGLQRLAHYFADGLETRLAAGTPKYILLQSASAADMLKAYKVYITASPFQRMTNFLANRTILKLVENVSSLHIIDFGITYGFQWPCLIQRLSERPGGPPRLRITGIDLPQPGFRPAERVEETGRRLEKYCKRFQVPFEYNCLAQKWETIKLEDLKIDRNEVTVVNCLYRLKNLSDETVTANCPRDTVLRLIRRINPNMFIHGVVNGNYNAPFFLTRFREALFHFSALFDMFDATVPRDDPSRLMFEKGLFGRDAINAIACEGAERVERPETYKQWQVRNQRAGFKQLPIAPELLNRVKQMVKKEYHKDFVVDEDGKWVLQGWKGRILQSLSSWVPT